MIEIIGPALSQWDVGRSVKITNIEADCFHLANKGDSKAVIMEIAEGQAMIPDYLLRTGKQICVYAVKNGITVESKIFYVKNRERPEDYVYEDDERNYIYEIVAAAKQATAEAKETTDELEVAWSSLCPVFVKSGHVVICEPLEGYPLEVVSNIPNTDEGIETVSVWRGGKNHFDISKVIGPSGANYVVNNGDGTLTINRDSTAYGAPFKLRDYAPGLVAGQTYTLSANSTGSRKYIYLQGNYNKQWIFGTPLLVNEAMLADSVLWYSEVGGLPAVISDIQIELGTVKTEFEPYKGDVFTAGLPDPQEIRALAGVNILSCGAGTITVTGRTDLKVYIDSMISGTILAATVE